MLIPKGNRLISVEPGEREQLKQHVNLVMLFFKCEQYIIVDKINMNVNGFCSLLHYVNSVVVELIFLRLFTSAIMGNVSITIYIINLCGSENYHGPFVIKVIPSNNNINCKATN